MVYRVYVEKKPGQTHEASGLLKEIKDFLQIGSLTDVRVLNRYDAENIEQSLFSYAVFDGDHLLLQEYGEGATNL